MVPASDSKYQADYGANTSCLASYKDLPHAFYPANLHLPWQTKASIQWMKLRTPENLDRCNQALEEIAQTYGCHFINCNAGLVNDRKEQKAEHTYDGVHLYANAYLKVYEALEPYLLN